MDENTNISFLEFAWSTLTEQQQYRINVKYELIQSLKNKPQESTKREVYRLIADKFGYTLRRIERIANEDLDNAK
jgi:hypothetical protein